MEAVIFKSEKSAMQSGLAKSTNYILRFLPHEKTYFCYAPAQWPGSTSTIKQQNLEFPSRQSAVDYCKAHNINYTEVSHHSKTIRPKSYTETLM